MNCKLLVIAALLLGYAEALGCAAEDLGPARAVDSAEPLRVTEPSANAAVSERPIVRGWIVDSQASVWVVVHPMEVADYWVQQPVTVDADGGWAVQIYVGKPGDDDVGKWFEIRAVANPRATLHQGDVLGNWPDAQWFSSVVQVRRE